MDYTLIGTLGVLIIVTVTTLAPRVDVARATVARGGRRRDQPAAVRPGDRDRVVVDYRRNPSATAVFVGGEHADDGFPPRFPHHLGFVGGARCGVCGGDRVCDSALIPGIGLATGIALGAIVSPTDAVATSVLRKAGVSPRLVTVLEARDPARSVRRCWTTNSDSRCGGDRGAGFGRGGWRSEAGGGDGGEIRADDGIRTRVDGFAGRCLASRPHPQCDHIRTRSRPTQEFESP